MLDHPLPRTQYLQEPGAPVPGASTPRLNRGAMVAQPWRGFTRSLLDAAWSGLAALGRLALGSRVATPPAPRAPWERAAARRRATLSALVLASAAGATAVLAHDLPPMASAALRWLQIGLFAVLFAWVAAGFFTALMGFWVLCAGDRHARSARSAGTGPIDPGARTALIMPICNEQVGTVFANLRAIWESLAASGGAGLFDLFILSDSGNPAVRAAELAAWARLRAEFAARGTEAGERVYYRWRQRRTKRKAGNVADFCRRWGRDYRYMVVLDADSVMSGTALVQLVRMMEDDARIGILQTTPQTCGLNTVHARAQQFAARVAGRLFTAGMQFWQLGESHYWGHNAILRVVPFMRHCALAPLRGRGGLSGEILSHDFVEAALMRRAGYHVWVVQDLGGSFEQQPPNLLEELQRDRRWCQGNLQNARLIAEPGLHGVHRAMLLTGAMAYLSAPLWLGYVLLSAGLWMLGERAPAASAAGTMAPLWLATATMLALPRVLGVVAIIARGEARSYGGPLALAAGTLIEGALAVLQAPVRMIAHTLFVLIALTGLKLQWKSPPREAEDVLWRDAARRFALISGAAGLAAAWVLDNQSQALVLLAPVGLPLLLAIPIIVWTSRSNLGQALRARRLLLTPEELRAPAVLRQAWGYARRAEPVLQWRDALTDPWLFDVVRAAVGPRNTGWGSRGKARRLLLRGLLQDVDTERLSAADRMRLLSEPQTLMRLRDQLAAYERLSPRRWLHGAEAATGRAPVHAAAPRRPQIAPLRAAARRPQVVAAPSL
jgi:membrane glycosyltransferase